MSPTPTRIEDRLGDARVVEFLTATSSERFAPAMKGDDQ
jgi:hypothetical protein